MKSERKTALLGLIAGAAMILSQPTQAQGAKPLRVCADPGNMPLSNNRGEGFQNRIAEVVAAALGTTATYDWRVSTGRGLIRGTLNSDACDLFMDLPADMEMVLSTLPIYRSTFVLVHRQDRNYEIKSLEDPLLKELSIGVYQMSAIREALGQRGVKQNTVVKHISYDGATNPQNQPSYIVQRVIDGELDMAAIWGPFAGYYRTQKQAPIELVPVNVMDPRNRLEFEMAVAVRRGNHNFKAEVEKALHDKRDEIRAILDDYGVPLVKCDVCLIDGTLPSQGQRQKLQMAAPLDGRPDDKPVDLAKLQKWLQDGADPTRELANAVIADDLERVVFLVERKGDVNAPDHVGYTPLHNAARIGSVVVAAHLIEHGAQVNRADRDGWTPLMFAAWRNDADMVKLLVSHRARIEATNANGMTPLTIAAQHGWSQSALALIGAGADVSRAVGAGGFTPLMLAAAKNLDDVVSALLKKGADVDARNTAGYTALMIAAAGNLEEIATILLDAGADPAVQSEDGRTALTIAQEREHQALLQLLQKQKPQASHRQAVQSG